MARRLKILAGAVIVLVAGCADDPSIDLGAFEADLPAAVVPEDPAVVGDVVCAEPVPEVIAQSLVCTATLHGVAITVDATVEVDEAGEAVATTVVREPLLELGSIEAEARQRLETDLGIGVEVACPGVVIVFEVDVAVDCTATHDGRPIDFVARIVDGDGNFTLTVAPEAG